MFRNYKTLFAVILLTIATVNTSFCSSAAKEEKIGLDQAQEFEKTVKLITDPAVMDRINSIGEKLSQIAKSMAIPADYGNSQLADFHYQFKVVDDKEINAMSLPGGIVYVNSGLLDFVKSDDELAGVIAHEVIHCAHHHVMTLVNKQSKMDTLIAIIAVAGGLGKMKGRDLTNVLYGAQSLRTARINGLGMQAENDADKGSVFLCQKAGFDPRGILRFMDRLNQYQENHGEIRNLGIYQDHPASLERTVRIAKVCNEIGATVDMREVAHLCEAKAENTATDGQGAWTVKIAGRVLCTVTDSGNLTAKDRAEHTCETLNQLLHDGIGGRDIRTIEQTSEIQAKGKTVFNVTSTDSAAAGLTVQASLSQAVQTLRYALWSDWLKSDE